MLDATSLPARFNVRLKKFSRQDAVLLLTMAGNIPVGIGGILHPPELNLASFSIWLIISAMLLYSTVAQQLPGWHLPLGFVIGNASLVILGLSIDGSTFNLGETEAFGLYGIVITLCIYGCVAASNKYRGHGKLWDPNIVFYGAILTDLVSFYPQAKQYLLPHDPMTWWGLAGYTMFLLASLLTAFWVEQMYRKLRMGPREYLQTYKKEKRVWGIIKDSLFALEQVVFIGALLPLMVR
jgi:hypothetical protein